MNSELLKKKEYFQTQIRKQNLHKILNLKRIKPKLINTDSEALTILVDGLDILIRSQSDQQLVEALKSMTYALKIYDFKIYPRIINKIINNTKWLITEPYKKDIIKEEATKLLAIICFNCSDIITFNDIPFEVLEGFNLEIIKYTLIALNQLISNFDPQNASVMKQNLFGSQIFKRLNLIIANFAHKNQFFEYIKIAFLSFAIPLCFIAYNWNINRNDNDYLRLCDFCVITLEKDITDEASKDLSLGLFFQNKEINFENVDGYSFVHELSYPFQLFILTTKIIQEFNVDVFDALCDCLAFQIDKNIVQEPLVKCLINIFKETNVVLEESLKEKIFKYIFQLNYTDRQNQGCIKEIIILAVNNSVNDQTMDESLFEAMGDSNHRMFPQTCHLLELMQYLEDKHDFETQKFLMQLVQNYITINGSFKYIEQSIQELGNFPLGSKLLERLGFSIQDSDQQEYYDQQIEI